MNYLTFLISKELSEKFSTANNFHSSMRPTSKIIALIIAATSIHRMRTLFLKWLCHSQHNENQCRTSWQGQK